tara:strand:+ start:328 stop:1182 length:855 start_codon:yes stop_codon:yes gene_type:complete
MNSISLVNEHILISAYNYDNSCVKKIKSLIEEEYAFLFKAVIIHGSLGTNEDINFSDFDGLLIVKDDWLNSKELSSFKKESFRHILEYDPIQHHGWFQLKESDLNNYPNNYLPISVLQNSKLIFPDINEIQLNIKLNDLIDYKEALFNVLNSLEERLALNWKPINMFQLKSFLSQIMLIPCLFYSALNNKGIFKRESFEAVKPYFSDEEWSPIKLCSKARLNWKYDLNFIQKVLMHRPERIFRKLTKKVISPPIDYNKFDYVTNDNFMNVLSLFIKKMKSHKDL